MSEYVEIESREHPSPEDVAAYVDGTVGHSDRQRIEAHAAECVECQRELAEVAGTLRHMRKMPNWRVWLPAVAAAAVFALLVAQPFRSGTEPAGTARFRAPSSVAGREGSVDIPVLAPPEEGTVSPTDVAFVWHSGGPGTSYQLTLADEEGSVVWTLATTDTIAALPETVSLSQASRYRWYVDGLLEDGRFASSGVRSFTTGR